MNIAVIGMGYIGCVNALMLCKKFDKVFIVEIDENKIQLAKNKQPLFYEKDFNWDDFYQHIEIVHHNESIDADIGLICVSAPFIDNDYQIDNCLDAANWCLENNITPILRSTIGVTGIINLIQTFSGRCFGFWPEFLREGNAIEDFQSNINYVSSVGDDPNLESFFEQINGHIIRDFKALSAVKQISNSFRAVKVAFANETGLILKGHNVDIEEYFTIFKALPGNCDQRYLKPGAPFGGSCLPKESKSVAALSKKNNIPSVIEASMLFNDAHIKIMSEHIIQNVKDEIGFIGFSFKNGSSDLRESPTMRLAETLKKRLSIYDLDNSSMGAFPTGNINDVENIFLGQGTNKTEADFNQKNIFSW